MQPVSRHVLVPEPLSPRSRSVALPRAEGALEAEQKLRDRCSPAELKRSYAEQCKGLIEELLFPPAAPGREAEADKARDQALQHTAGALDQIFARENRERAPMDEPELSTRVQMLRSPDALKIDGLQFYRHNIVSEANQWTRVVYNLAKADPSAISTIADLSNLSNAARSSAARNELLSIHSITPYVQDKAGWDIHIGNFTDALRDLPIAEHQAEIDTFGGDIKYISDLELRQYAASQATERINSFETTFGKQTTQVRVDDLRAYIENLGRIAQRNESQVRQAQVAHLLLAPALRRLYNPSP